SGLAGQSPDSEVDQQTGEFVVRTNTKAYEDPQPDYSFFSHAGPTNYLRNPLAPNHWILNGLSNTLSDLLGLDSVAESSYAIGDNRQSTSDRLMAGVQLGAIVIMSAGGLGEEEAAAS